ncbi:MAG: 3-hydroxybutyrate dehydrogenase [Myxococcales bacterium]|nr:3-hydroxybutyrate dehydrogenase [Myxococcales bacterium]
MTAPFLTGRRALITGAASGIGLAIAQALHREGAAVVLSDLSAEALARAAETMPGAVTLTANLGLRDEVKGLAAAAGAIDILVNNAGLQNVSPVEQFDEAKWDLLLAVMLTAPFLLTKALLPGMYARGWGRIVNVGSVHSLVASPYKSAYVSAKHGIMGFTKTVALEAAQHSHNITVNALCPSYVRTPLVEKQIADQARVHGVPEDEVVSRILLTQNAQKRLIEPDACAQYALFLCRDEAWSITGTAATMDAGWLAH